MLLCGDLVYNQMSGLQGSSSSLSELSRASSGHPLDIVESPRSPCQPTGHFAHPLPSSSGSALPCPSGFASSGRPVFSLPQSIRHISSAPQHALLSSEPSSSLQGQGSSLQHPALPYTGRDHGTLLPKPWPGLLLQAACLHATAPHQSFQPTCHCKKLHASLYVLRIYTMYCSLTHVSHSHTRTHVFDLQAHLVTRVWLKSNPLFAEVYPRE